MGHSFLMVRKRRCKSILPVTSSTGSKARSTRRGNPFGRADRCPVNDCPPRTVWGVDYGSADHGLILLHASNAITFDLEAIRRANPGCKLLGFRATAGNSDSGTSAMGEMYADFWVLVDGQSRFRRRQIRSSDGAYSVAVPIGQSDRFLTLAATDGGDGISHDWIIFGDPRLELLPAEKSEQRDTDGL